jgi:hypothetical protein
MVYKLIEFIKEIELQGISRNIIILVISIYFDRDRYFYLGFGANLKSEIWQFRFNFFLKYIPLINIFP